ncbi:hypothetical protein SCHPADRAFT_486755 [Schizopora paradoxa]|uniref:MYND-type domain-containing protein n=1 Tax=Schizopora paradoxa TaxID=27342 RepID=A0A0H2RH00_9AGAM|nr:hypothetical protein SCHPADRAFT_486755 [Schizopora paradoxa]
MQLGLHAMRQVQLVLLDAELDAPTISKASGESITSCCFGLMACCGEVPGALHWMSVLLDHDLLRCVARLAHYPYVTDSVKKILTDLFESCIPPLLVHREFVITTVRAVRAAMQDGSSTKHFESSFLKDTWRTFVRLILERTIYNAIYERSSVEIIFEEKRCQMCKLIEENCENGLRKCAACAVAVYCSRECQKAGWKSGHRRECESLKGTAESAGEALKYGENHFLHRLARIDVRRHASGIKNAIQKDKLLKDAPRKDIVIFISYATYPPTIKVLHFSAATKELGEASRLREQLKEDQMLMHINSNRGGPLTSQQTGVESTDLLDGPKKYGGGDPVRVTFAEDEMSTISAWGRISCQSEGGEELEFELDEIDVCLLDAYRSHRPAADEEDSSKAQTIIDYLEKRIIGDELVPEVDYLKL